jgi:hypothetical protein
MNDHIQDIQTQSAQEPLKQVNKMNTEKLITKGVKHHFNGKKPYLK